MKHIIRKNRKQNIKILLRVIILAIMLFTLTGCIPNNFTTEEKNAFLQEAKEVVSEYFSGRYNGAVIQEIQPETTVINSGLELTEYASGLFAWQEQTYQFVVNTETGEVYTSFYLGEIEELLKEALLRELDFVCDEAIIEKCTIKYLKGDSGKKLDSDYCFQNVFPGDESTETLLEKILQDTETYRFSMRLQYKGESLPPEMMEWKSPFPTQTGIMLYHIAEEHAFCEEKFSYSILPSLSEEILVLNFYLDTADYTRYQTLVQDGLRVVYNACERTRTENTVTESVIAEEDITLTVTDEFIRLDCAKDNYSMYLFTEDEKIAKKYLYVFLTNNVRRTVEKTEKGMWYPFENGYVYADNVYVATPYVICPYYYEGNIIYSSPQKKSKR